VKLRKKLKQNKAKQEEKEQALLQVNSNYFHSQGSTSLRSAGHQSANS